jgi:phenylalanine-4-hydroxylase
LSSYGEAKYVMSDPSPHVVRFNLERVLRTGYYIDDFQATYFAIDSFASLFKECVERPFIPLYDEYRQKPKLSPFDLIESDTILRRGTGEYWREFPKTKTKLK